ncbi:hypothetical protein L9F63_006599, partial [Diploptera punctata]
SIITAGLNPRPWELQESMESMESMEESMKYLSAPEREHLASLIHLTPTQGAQMELCKCLIKEQQNVSNQCRKILIGPMKNN